jgi:hypothetical protein
MNRPLARPVFREGNAMSRFLAHLIAVFGVTFGTASLAHADILVGLPAPYTGPQAWMGEGIEAD